MRHILPLLRAAAQTKASAAEGTGGGRLDSKECDPDPGGHQQR